MSDGVSEVANVESTDSDRQLLAVAGRVLGERRGIHRRPAELGKRLEDRLHVPGWPAHRRDRVRRQLARLGSFAGADVLDRL